MKALRLGEPQDYFHRLALDTLQVSVRGKWRDEQAPLALLDKRRSAEVYQQVGIGIAQHECPDGRRLTVYPHGGRPAYQVLMRDGDGLEIRALPQAQMPAFLVRFGARWCVENSVPDLGAWIAAFVRALGFEPESLSLSEAHIRCDTPVPFVVDDVKGMRGAGTRNGRFNTHMYGGKLSGVDNLGGHKAVKFCIYDKRLEQQQKEGVLWPSVWSAYGIPPAQPIWRVEARWDRTTLKAFGVEALTDLTPATMAGLWHAFASRYLVFVEPEETDKRTARAVIAEKWAKVQACGVIMPKSPIASEVEVSTSKLLKQATGCIAKAMAVSGIGHADAEVQAVIEEALTEAEGKVTANRADYVRELLQKAVERYPDEAFASARALGGDIRSFIGKALSKRTLAAPFQNPQLGLSGGER